MIISHGGIAGQRVFWVKKVGVTTPELGGGA
jgi:hypothetical protein